MLKATQVESFFSISILSLFFLASTIACESNKNPQDNYVQDSNNQDPETPTGGSGDTMEDAGLPVQEADTGSVDASQEDVQQEQPAVDAGGGMDGGGMDPGAGWAIGWDADAGTFATDGNTEPTGNVGLGQVCTFDPTSAIAMPMPDGGIPINIEFDPPILNGVCVNSDDPCEGGILSAVEIPQLDPANPIEVDLTGGCQGGLACCINTDQCAKLDTSIQEAMQAFLDGPSVLNPEITARESLEGLLEMMGMTELSMSYSCTGETECTGLYSLPLGCTAGEVCCAVTSMDDLIRSLMPTP